MTTLGTLYTLSKNIWNIYVFNTCTGEAETILENASQFFSFDMEALIDDGKIFTFI